MIGKSFVQSTLLVLLLVSPTVKATSWLPQSREVEHSLRLGVVSWLWSHLTQIFVPETDNRSSLDPNG